MIGINLFKWINLLAQNRFNIRIKHIPKVVLITLLNIVLYPSILFERAIFKKKIWNTEIKKDPIFIIGHWRSGTTHLHKMLALDKQFGYLSLTETGFPHLILTGSRVLHALMRPITPKKRATDKVDMFPEMPHEHEFALLFLTLYSPLLSVSFPDRFDHYKKYLTFKGVEQHELDEWKKWFLYLVKKLTIKEKGKQLVLKNPLDTCRIKEILAIFPNAKFIHLRRNPYDLFFSTKKLHKHNIEIYAFQKPRYDLDQLILDNYNEMYKKYYDEVDLIPEGNFVDIQFEELKERPLEQLEKIYTTLKLDGLENAKKSIAPYLLSVSNYQPSKYKISKKDMKRIYSSWHKTIDKWGYEKAVESTKN